MLVKRAKLEIVMDILKFVSEGVGKPTLIMHKANVSWNAFERYLRFLIEQGLITEKKQGKRVIYEITEKGLKTLSYFRRIKEEPLLAYIPK